MKKFIYVLICGSLFIVLSSCVTPSIYTPIPGYTPAFSENGKIILQAGITKPAMPILDEDRGTGQSFQVLYKLPKGVFFGGQYFHHILKSQNNEKNYKDFVLGMIQNYHFKNRLFSRTNTAIMAGYGTGNVSYSGAKWFLRDDLKSDYDGNFLSPFFQFSFWTPSYYLPGIIVGFNFRYRRLQFDESAIIDNFEPFMEEFLETEYYLKSDFDFVNFDLRFISSRIQKSKYQALFDPVAGFIGLSFNLDQIMKYKI